MDITLPVYIKFVKGTADRDAAYRAQLLFNPAFSAENIVLQRAVQRLARNVRKRCDEIGKSWNQRGFAAFLLNPSSLQHTTAKVELQLKDHRCKCKFFIVWFESLGRRIAFCPELPHLWFEFEKGKLEQRTQEVLQKWFTSNQKEDEGQFSPPETFAIKSKCWLTSIDVSVNINQESRDEIEQKMLAMWTRQTVSGDSELVRVGRCLDWLYPDDLNRAFLREADASSLQRLLDLPDQRPVLLVGDASVGKTALIHEVVARRVEKRQQRLLEKGKDEKSGTNKENVWLLAPQRLISGMSYVGQWEQRVHAILKTASEKKHVLYFDDLIGLFRAGKSSCSNLCVADLLRKPLQQRSVRFLAEATTGSYEQLLNLDRSFADLFHVFYVDEMDEADTLRVCIRTSRTVERLHKSRFDPDSLPTVIQLQRQYVGQQCFPGKAVRFLRQLAVKFPKATITRENVLWEMASSCGIQLPMLDDQKTLKRQDVIKSFENQIVGQADAVSACADLVITEKARLSPDGKPIMTMLFTGPTGVGKTETAKALSKYLFDDAQQMVRFDLNEFKTSHSAARLVGTFDQPEGLLTSAIRHRPYSVILFDEIEKAHPDVFDVLLQVIGEGRLTDAIGRTTDFGNTVIVMTSNLGAKRAGQTLGFVPGDDQRHYIAAAEKFFRPEFFNRIDRVVPFHRLDRTQIAEIAQRLMRQVVSREGLMRRRCVLDVGPALISDIVDVGYDQAMGARGLKRAIEQNFTHPVAEKLSAIRSENPTLITVQKKDRSDDKDSNSDRLQIDLMPLLNVKLVEQPQFESLYDLAEMADRFLKRVRADHFADRPRGEITGSGMSPGLLRYFSLTEEALRIEEMINLIRSVSGSNSVSVQPAMPIGQSRRSTSDRVNRGVNSRSFLQDVASIGDIHQFLRDKAAGSQGSTESKATQLVSACRTLEAMANSTETEAIFFVKGSRSRTVSRGIADSRGVDVANRNVFFLQACLHEQAFRSMDFDWRAKDANVNGRTVRLLYLSGSGAAALQKTESGYSLMCDSQGRLQLRESGFVTAEDASFEQLKNAIRSDDILTEPLSCESLMIRRHEVIRFWGETSVDFRTGETISDSFDVETLTSLMYQGLPLPIEFVAGAE